MTTPVAAPRAAEELNRGLHALFDRDERLYLVGEDVLDPYGGAFKITKGLSSRHPDRVLTTPLSEAGIIGVAGGLALCGDRVVVEVMFGDFAALGFDQLLNFASKSVSMYGQRVPMSLVVRCPVGGGRGYGPTHSQSPQKHFVGIPNLELYELSPFHDPGVLLDHALGQGVPCVFFEDKVLYTRRVFRDGRVDDDFRYELVGGPAGWAQVSAGGGAPDVAVIAPGGLVHRTLEAAASLRADHGVTVEVVVPGRLYPLDVEPVLPVLRAAGRVAVVEEGTAGGTWGSEVASRLAERMWDDLRQPVLQLSTADSIIPTAVHLERSVLLSAERIRDALGQRSPTGPAPLEPFRDTAHCGVPITTPKLNNNDAVYLVVEWLRSEGDWVEVDEPVVELETSKAVEEVVAPRAGYLHQLVTAGEEHVVGDVLGQLVSAPRDLGDEPTSELSRAQRGTAAVVAKSHAEIPAAFTVVEAEVDDALRDLERISDETGAVVGLAELLVKAIAAAHEDFPIAFATLLDNVRLAYADAPEVGITLDAGTALYVPVVGGAHRRSVSDIADALMDFRMKAFRGEFAAGELAGGNITLSLNSEPNVVLVQPLVLPPQVCTVSLAGVRSVCRVADDSTVSARQCVHLGLAYDHRVINGRDAVRFLTVLRASLEEHDRRSRLLSE